MVQRELFLYFAENHGILLTESEAREIKDIVSEAIIKEAGLSVDECEHRHAKFVYEIAETYCPECREII